MKKTIKYLDLTAPKFNLYINGKSCYRTIWGGLFHLLIVIALIVMFSLSLASSILRKSPTVLINSGYFSNLNFYNYPQPNNQQISIEVSESIAKFHSFVVSGSFLMKQKNRNYYINAKTVKEQSLIVYLYQISTSQLYLLFLYHFQNAMLSI